ncbi:hypothetical protein EW145_g4401 [Phellinidium pouzarii]|uniref:Brix domain-containing protein n=1 Tax=Phellinidium pouzarii TaxID=167371 RepID=A0A4S4L8J5_9AGAM|nr:hypothetical protein EW145_g4401 [Phellinidium pouzarii]
MPSNHLEPSSIKNKIKREEIARKTKKTKRQAKLQKRLARAKVEANDPLAKKKRLANSIPRTLENTREFDPSNLTAAPVPSPEASPPIQPSDPTQQPTNESALDIASDPFASYFASAFNSDSSIPPNVLITTSNKASKLTYAFCDELVGVIPGAEFIRRKKGKGFEIGRIAAWAAGRGYGNMIVINEDMKKPNAITLIHLPMGPSAYFKLSSVQLTKQISVRVLIQSKKAALQEIGPRFTLKLRWVKKGLPAMHVRGRPSKPLEMGSAEVEDESEGSCWRTEIIDAKLDEESDHHIDDVVGTGEQNASAQENKNSKIEPPAVDEYIWMWKPDLETTRRTFFL